MPAIAAIERRLPETRKTDGEIAEERPRAHDALDSSARRWSLAGIHNGDLPPTSPSLTGGGEFDHGRPGLRRAKESGERFGRDTRRLDVAAQR